MENNLILKSDSFIVYNKPKFNLRFHNGSENIGRLFQNEDGKLEFEGHLEESAKIFFDNVIKLNIK